MALQQPTTPFVWGSGGGRLTPEELARQRAIQEQILGRGTDTSPVQHWTQGAARVADALAGVVKDRRLDKAESANQADQARITEGLMGAFGGMGAAPAAVPSSASSAMTTPSFTGGEGPTGEAAAKAGVPQPVANAQPIELASSLLGAGEVPDRSTIQEYLKNGGVNLDPATTAWCAAYVNATLAQTGIKGTGSNLARSFLEFGEPVDEPARGDIAVFSRGDPNGWQGHVGFFEGRNPDGTIRVLGGNQGDKVSVSSYGTDRLLGFRRPTGAAGAVNAMAAQQPVQVASADPSFMPQAAPAGAGPDTMNALMGGVATAQQANPQQAVAQALMAGGGADPWQGMRNPTVAPAQAGPQQVAQAAPQAGGGISPIIMEALSSPYATDQQRSIAQLLLQQEMQSRDPMRAIEMEKAQLELQALRNPQQKPIEVGGVLLDPTTMQPIFDSRQPSDGGFTLSPGQQRFDAQGNPIASGGAEPGFELVSPDEAQQLGLPGGQGYQRGPDGRIYPVQAPSGVSIESDGQGGFRMVQGAGVTGKPLTEAQSKDTVFSTRAEGALPLLDQFDTLLTSRTDIAKDWVPFGFGREYQDPEFQLAQQAGNEFLQAILRKDTGAAITEQEQVLYGRTYLPAPGDSPEVIAQKKQSRRRALEAIKAGLPATAIVAQEMALRKTNSAAPSASNGIPEGVDPADWEFMTPEEKALFQ